MTDFAPPRDRRHPPRFTQVGADPRQRLTQRALHLADRITTPPHRPNQRLLFDVKPNRPHTNLHRHIIGFRGCADWLNLRSYSRPGAITRLSWDPPRRPVRRLVADLS